MNGQKIIDCHLSASGYIVKKKDCGAILKKLTVVEKPTPGRPPHMGRTILKAYKLIKNSQDVLIPAFPDGFTCRVLRTELEDDYNGIRTVDLDYDCELYDYQKAIVDRIVHNEFSNFKDPYHACRAYLQMDTGLGKTRVGIAIALSLRTPTLVVVPTKAIAAQWIDEASDVCPHMNCGMYTNKVSGSKTMSGDHDLVVIIINTFRNKGLDFIKGYGLIILDEAHELIGPCNSKALWLARSPAVLGLSATPSDNPTGLDQYVTKHLGPAIRSSEVEGFNVESFKFSGMVKVINYYGNPDYCEGVVGKSGMISAISTISSLVQDCDRLRLIAKEVRILRDMHLHSDRCESLGLGPRPVECSSAEYPEGEVRKHGIFVFAELRDALPTIRDAICEELGDDNAVEVPEISTLMGGVSRKYMNDVRDKKSHIVLTTYGFSRRGISLANMTAMVLATPRRNGSTQIIGRIFRRGSDESIVRQIVDIVDMRCVLKGQSVTRKKVYESKGFPMTIVRA